MKIIAIRGKNLASLEGEFEIDFTSEPLKSAGIFAITGSTGAGKSTLLDCMCLALFDVAPRLNNAESINISDVEDKTIGLKDSRNILRKGCADGYAEVDFIALNGSTYRSRWTVRRARNRADGALQASVVQLHNLSYNNEEQGTKTELLRKVTELIGLTFDQFTRAVLLAQGEFSTFLKAKQNEKAELLEKLTGTEIYSQISILIYKKANEAQADFNALKQRIDDVKLLSEDELQTFETEKKQLESETLPLKKQVATVEKQIEWMKTQDSLQAEVANAEKTLLNAQTDIKTATPRFEYIALSEKSNEVRDDYFRFIELHKSQDKQSELHKKSKAELKAIETKFAESEANLQRKKNDLDELEKMFIALKPEIQKARELDLILKAENETLQQQQKELAELTAQQKEVDNTVRSLNKKIAENEIAQLKLQNWFAENEQFATIVPDSKWIISQINLAGKVNHESIESTKSLVTCNDLLVKQKASLVLLETESERLNKLLPAEISMLRQRLTDNEPCPVCGSLHHPFAGSTSGSTAIDEAELENQKQKNAQDIADEKSKIDETNKRITELETSAKKAKSDFSAIATELNPLLLPLGEWEDNLDNDNLQKQIFNIAKEWTTNKEQVEKNVTQQNIDQTKLNAEAKLLKSISENAIKKQETTEAQLQKFNSLTEERSKVLFNKSPEEAEQRYEKSKNERTKALDEARVSNEKLDNEKSRLAGSISQLENNIQTTETLISVLREKITNWLAKNQQFTHDLLDNIMAKSHEWLANEKKQLDELKRNETIAQTTLDERANKLKQHNASDERADKEISKEQLLEQQSALTEQLESLSKRVNEIVAQLMMHAQGKEKIKAFEKELLAKGELNENWAKLNDLLGSASGAKFKTIAQSYTLDVLLGYANKHLEELTNRYKLEKISNTLALQVIDNDMLGNARPVHSLSGGESFLISLALALGLSALSSNRMKIETLFIDEGFGSLDIDTLSVAMDALENLQTQGRRIGVISHVSEMKERISTQIQVEKHSNGRSSVRVVG